MGSRLVAFFHPFVYKLSENILALFRGRFLLWQTIAFIATFLLVTSGFDWWYFSNTRGALVYPIALPAGLLGFALPILLPFCLLAIGAVKRNLHYKMLAYALGQAAFLGWSLSSFYKAFTGRAHPQIFSNGEVIDISKVFHFGFLEGGIFWGWPSSHTSVAFAVATAVIVLIPNRIARFCAGALALYIGLAVSISIHWFSDFVAGAIIGILVGVVVGKAFKNRTM